MNLFLPLSTKVRGVFLIVECNMIRLLDILFCSIALMLFTPIFIFVIIILRFTGEGEILFFQERVGRSRKKFKVIKFVTMLKNSPNMGSGSITSMNDPRILPVGKFLRKTKLNEMPQLINVLLGHMSLIGPRPHAERDLRGVGGPDLDVMMSMKPGLSGIGSIVFRNEEEILQTFKDPRPFYDEVIAPYKAKLELWYLKKMSPKLYLTLICLTVTNVVKPDIALLFKIFPDLPPIPDHLAQYYECN